MKDDFLFFCFCRKYRGKHSKNKRVTTLTNSLEMTLKSDELHYFNKNFSTHEAIVLNYQLKVCTNLRVVGTIYAANTFLLLV